MEFLISTIIFDTRKYALILEIKFLDIEERFFDINNKSFYYMNGNFPPLRLA